MRKFALIIALVASGAAAADELTAGDLQSFCNARDEMIQAACRFFILGAVQGISLGDGSVSDGSGHYVPRNKTHFCIPDNTPQSQMITVFQTTIQEVARAHPEDLKLPAISVLDATLSRAFPCAKPK